MAKARTPRLGRGLSSMFAQPVTVTPPNNPAQTEQERSKTPAGSDQSAGGHDGKSTDTGQSAHSQVIASPAVPHEADAAAASKAATTAELTAAQHDPPATSGREGLCYLDLDAITPNPHQPRQQMAEGPLQQLADSIAREGVMQPIIVRPAGPSGQQFQLVAGERRWRAARLAGLTQIPALVRLLDDRQLAQWALIENLQREDLNPIERAEAFQRLIDQFALSHDEVAQQVGGDRSTISNSLRLLGLGEPTRQLVREGLLSAGHGRALAALSDHDQQAAIAQRALREQWPVRRTEQVVRELQTAATSPVADQGGHQDHNRQGRAAHLDDLEKQIGQQLSTRVRIRPGRKKGTGTLCLDFYSIDQFDTLMARLKIQVDGE